MNKEPIVQIKNLKKTIGKKAIIKGISFNIYPGEVFGFLGPNGAGKTTTIRMIVGLMSISDGEILINNLSIRYNFEKAIRYVGGIVENPEMYKYLTGYQNLLHYARMIKGINKERIDKVVNIVGLKKRIHDKVKTYSLGMRQRLGLAQALLHSPRVLILDEPTNGLDPAGIREIRDYLRKLAKEEDLAVMVSSHLLSEMELMCDRIGIIQEGKLIGVKEIQEFVTESEQNSVRFILDPIVRASQIIEKKYTVLSMDSQNKQFTISVRKEEIPEIVTELVKEQIRIYGVETITKTLEDRFLEVTGSDEIA